MGLERAHEVKRLYKTVLPGLPRGRASQPRSPPTSSPSACPLPASAPVRSPPTQLLFLGREYPQGYAYFQSRCKAAFDRQRGLSDPAAIDRALAHGQYVVRELEALYFLRKYRELRRRYDTTTPADALTSIAETERWTRDPPSS